MTFNPHTAEDRAEMMQTIGITEFDQLVGAIPDPVRYPDLRLPRLLTEMEAAARLSDLAERNLAPKPGQTYLGAGSYQHFIPATVNQILSRGEYYTAYTPYQPEVAQGTLQVIYEFQSMVAALLGTEIANASMYDGATAAAEGCLLAVHYTRRRKILVSASFHPEWLRVLRTFTSGMGLQIEVIGDVTEPWRLEASDVRTALDDQAACVLVQYPNFYGSIEDMQAFADAAHEAGALLVASTYPIALGLLKPPGALGADIAVGEGQPLGNELNFGGPYLGLFATRKKFVRYMPGRLVGATKDLDGNRGYVLTLQTREQHIRRDKATSNICTNEALNALAATVYLALLGKQGLPHVAQLCLNNAHYLADHIGALPGWEILTPQLYFNEFLVRCPVPAAEIIAQLLERDMLVGVDLGQFLPEHPDKLLVCATEMNTKAEMDRYIEAVSRLRVPEGASAR